ncbi:MAG TPA: adenylate/guanylate cyclase domain-containing protein, partial [Rhizomicrobium sp.]|nr:adenylate/guanylate cyclase domain-containing protein [Rhizomicrobium sp.]
LDRLKINRARVFDPQVAIHGGRIFKLIGDGALAEFASVIAAVECALAIQSATEKLAADEIEGRRIRYRIGVNLGEVIVEGDDIYGEGVNVAARLQSLASIGGIAVSRVVKDQIDGKVSCAFEDMGEHQVKDHDRPVHAFSARAAQAASPAAAATAPSGKHSICVLPFANMSGDLEQEYFSDGITEDIITDLSKVSALGVTARNTAFQFKGKSVDVPQIARQLKASHVLEGSVRKSGGRVRITAQLIDGKTGEHVWAERYDRDLDDIFALQDEISEAIVKALKLKLLPEEKKAIERRGTENAEAYNLLLLARQTYATGLELDPRRNETIVRLCRRATEIDPNYARAWALMALGQMILRANQGGGGDGGLVAAEKALALDVNLAEAHAVKARILAEDGRAVEAAGEIAMALKLDPESYEVNKAAAFLSFQERHHHDAIRYWTKATSLMELDFHSANMLVTCYTALGDRPAALEVARITLDRCEKVLAQDRNNGAAMGHISVVLAVLGQSERTKEMMNRAMLVDPDNMDMRYNFACTLATHLKDNDGAIELLRPILSKVPAAFVNYAKIDPDLDAVRGDPQFIQMIADAEARLAAEKG